MTLLNLLKSTGTGANSSMSSLSTSVYRLAKFVFSPTLEVSTCVIFFTLTLIFPSKLLNGIGKY